MTGSVREKLAALIDGDLENPHVRRYLEIHRRNDPTDARADADIITEVQVTILLSDFLTGLSQ